MWNVKIAWLLAWLLLWTVWDLKYRVICLWQGVLVVSVGVLWQLLDRQLWTGSILGGMVLGVTAWGCSWLTGDRFGRGDALVILCLGIYLGFSQSLVVLLWGLLVASVVSVFLLVTKKCSAKQAIPFVPCLTTGYVIMLGMKLAGGVA